VQICLFDETDICEWPDLITGYLLLAFELGFGGAEANSAGYWLAFDITDLQPVEGNIYDFVDL